jgi:hypothetical protein
MILFSVTLLSLSNAYRSNASDPGAWVQQVQSSANTLIMNYLYPAKSLVLQGKDPSANLRVQLVDNFE